MDLFTVCQTIERTYFHSTTMRLATLQFIENHKTKVVRQCRFHGSLLGVGRDRTWKLVLRIPLLSLVVADCLWAQSGGSVRVLKVYTLTKRDLRRFKLS